ncbi:hypothetical protein AK812_SmicGene38064 [Symbiodinium microadriaticum]|uniref:Uncharacterized protein n=1 Tax=Symbiodinium microadriaticum TaxID=2951 RepID=A0A1Q9CEN9_SYMMI|nr:hypothetical protein AK812_SmicGene38064 [Symbiodinium microadriaticum]CAE7186004.1 unnamed protein product [Symbiodinium microadriaticum]
MSRSTRGGRREPAGIKELVSPSVTQTNLNIRVIRQQSWKRSVLRPLSFCMDAEKRFIDSACPPPLALTSTLRHSVADGPEDCQRLAGFVDASSACGISPDVMGKEVESGGLKLQAQFKFHTCKAAVGLPRISAAWTQADGWMPCLRLSQGSTETDDPNPGKSMDEATKSRGVHPVQFVPIVADEMAARLTGFSDAMTRASKLVLGTDGFQRI